MARGHVTGPTASAGNEAREEATREEEGTTFNEKQLKKILTNRARRRRVLALQSTPPAQERQTRKMRTDATGRCGSNGSKTNGRAHERTRRDCCTQPPPRLHSRPTSRRCAASPAPASSHSRTPVPRRLRLVPAPLSPLTADHTAPPHASCQTTSNPASPERAASERSSVISLPRRSTND